ncbi:MAG TPA: hypothetical protein EYQ25_13635 [Planctomycetes bacterium]|nr:hypothetical protein [Planctomycetota bacterium]HIL38541.1 hypothetical protein [Planctomycetota bacterium]
MQDPRRLLLLTALIVGSAWVLWPEAEVLEPLRAKTVVPPSTARDAGSIASIGGRVVGDLEIQVEGLPDPGAMEWKAVNRSCQIESGLVNSGGILRTSLALPIYLELQRGAESEWAFLLEESSTSPLVVRVPPTGRVELRFAGPPKDIPTKAIVRLLDGPGLEDLDLVGKLRPTDSEKARAALSGALEVLPPYPLLIPVWMKELASDTRRAWPVAERVLSPDADGQIDWLRVDAKRDLRWAIRRAPGVIPVPAHESWAKAIEAGFGSGAPQPTRKLSGIFMVQAGKTKRIVVGGSSGPVLVAVFPGDAHGASLRVLSNGWAMGPTGHMEAYHSTVAQASANGDGIARVSGLPPGKYLLRGQWLSDEGCLSFGQAQVTLPKSRDRVVHIQEVEGHELTLRTRFIDMEGNELDLDPAYFGVNQLHISTTGKGLFGFLAEIIPWRYAEDTLRLQLQEGEVQLWVRVPREFRLPGQTGKGQELKRLPGEIGQTFDLLEDTTIILDVVIVDAKQRTQVIVTPSPGIDLGERGEVSVRGVNGMLSVTCHGDGKGRLIGDLALLEGEYYFDYHGRDRASETPAGKNPWIIATGRATLGPGTTLHVQPVLSAAIKGTCQMVEGQRPYFGVVAMPVELAEFCAESGAQPYGARWKEDGSFSMEIVVANSVLVFRGCDQTVRVGPAGSVTDVGMLTFSRK